MAELIYLNDTIKNKYDNSPFRIPLRNKKRVIVNFALVDEDDFERVSKYKWYLSTDGYGLGTVEKKTIRLHHFVFKNPENRHVIDHINQDRLNNQKSNLREVSKSMNSQNIKKNIDIATTSKFKGVSWNKNNKNWLSCGRYNKKRVQLGSFETEEEAGKIYDIYTFKVYGKEANNNNLIAYEDTLNANIDDLIKNASNKYNTPKNIHFNKRDNIFFAQKNYKKIYKGVCRETLDEALKDLEEINKEIESIKKLEIEEYNNQEIIRNNEGIPFIEVKDIEVLVDEEFWHELNKMSWTINPGGYIVNGQGKLMHRIVMKAKEGEIVDHINKAKYDNRSCNLRIASHSLNSHNRTKCKNAYSKYFGVSKDRNLWRCIIKCNGVEYRLGSFKKEIDAARAYNEKAIELYGENANLNTLPENL
jgi:hypothetical protein